MRLFIGVELSEDIVGELKNEVAYLRSHFPNIRWVRPFNFHITLKFFGNVEEKHIPDICTSMDNTAENISGFSVSVENIHCLPNLKRVRTICAGCEAGRIELANLHAKLDMNLSSIGFEKDKRKFLPHITLGRVKTPKDAWGLEEIINDAPEIHFGITDIESMTLFMSELKKTGAEYSPMHRIELAF
jgi:2'-5' RNA ligase